MGTKKKSADVRCDQIITAAIEESEKVGYQNITRANVAERCGLGAGSINKYYNTMPQLRRAVIRHAIKIGNAAVVAQGLGANDAHAQKAPDALKQKAIKILLG